MGIYRYIYRHVCTYIYIYLYICVETAVYAGECREVEREVLLREDADEPVDAS